MRRAAALVAVGLLALVAATAPEPPPPEATAPTTTTTTPEPTTAAAFSSCPWAVASDQEETFIGLDTLQAGDVLVTFPLAGETRQTIDDSLPGPGATSIRLGQYLSQGLAPATVEYSDSPAATAALVSSQGRLAATVCPSSTPKVWHLPGGSTEGETELILQLYNPFSENATVTVSAHSEFGPEQAEDLEGLVVAARSWMTFDLHTVFPGRHSIGLRVGTDVGNVVPALVMTLERGSQAMWTGLGNAEIWEFPLVRLGEMQATLIVDNEGPEEVSYELDLVGEEETQFAVTTRSVPALAQDEVVLSELAEGRIGARVRADGPVSAVVAARGGRGFGVVAGSALTSQQWLLPGFGAHPDASYQVWLLNPGTADLTVTLSALSADGLSGAPDKVSVPAGTVRTVPIGSFQVFGMIAEAPQPFSVAWSAEVEGDVAFVQAIPVRQP